MSVTETHDLRAILVALPKVELHRHLEGSVRLSTLVEVAQQHNIDVPARDPEGLRPYVQVMPGDPTNSAHFLSKFEVLRRFYCAPDVIQRIAREAVEDAAADNVKYMELRFTPKAFAKLRDFAFRDVIHWVCDTVEDAQKGKDICVKLIVSLNRHENAREGERILRDALDYRDHGIVGVDLAGRETENSARPFFEAFKYARQQGMSVTIHAGEWAGPRNIREAIEKLGASRIGHGVRVVEDSTVATLAREAGITFEICPSSNIQSGAVHSVQFHPLRDMYQLNLNTTLNTDDPSISNIVLTDEYLLAVTRLGLTLDEVKQTILNSARSAFLPPEDRATLVADLTLALGATPQKADARNQVRNDPGR